MTPRVGFRSRGLFCTWSVLGPETELLPRPRVREQAGHGGGHPGGPQPLLEQGRQILRRDRGEDVRIRAGVVHGVAVWAGRRRRTGAHKHATRPLGTPRGQMKTAKCTHRTEGGALEAGHTEGVQLQVCVRSVSQWGWIEKANAVGTNLRAS